MINKIVIMLLSVYVLFCSIIYFGQNNIMFFPQPTVNENLQKIIGVQNKVLGYTIKSELPTKKLAILFHGNAGSASDRIYYKQLIPADRDLIIAEYPGYGANFNFQISKESFYDSAKELLNSEQLKNYSDVVIIGESIGTGIASIIASEFKKDLILITPYSSIKDIASKLTLLKIVPVDLLLKNNWNNIETLKDFNNKILIIISQYDEVIDPSLAVKLFESIKSTNKTELIVKDAGHNTWSYKLTEKDKTIFTKFFNM